MNNSVASSTSDIISFRVREENERNREGGRGRQARLGIIRCSRRTKPLVAASFIVRNRRLTFAVHHHYAIPNFNVDSDSRNDSRRRAEMAPSKVARILWDALFTSALSGIILEAELRALISLAHFSPLMHFENFEWGM